MNNYMKPKAEEIVVSIVDVLAISGILLNQSNADFNNPDETI